MAEEVTKATAAKVRALLAKLEELQATQAAIVGEIATLMSGGPAIGELMKRARLKFDEVRMGRGYVGVYLWAKKHEHIQLSRLIKLLGIEELEARMVRFARSNDPWFSKTSHSFGAFAAAIDQFVTATAPGELELVDDAPADCQHKPRCLDDVQHTKRRAADMSGQPL